eukprot:1883785-Prymnesium_polylepis.1
MAAPRGRGRHVRLQLVIRPDESFRKFFTTSVQAKIINPPHRAHSSPGASTPPWLVRPIWVG